MAPAMSRKSPGNGKLPRGNVGSHLRAERKGGKARVSVLVPGAVFLLAEFAIGGWQAVIHAVVHGREGSQVRKHGLQIVVGQALEFAEGHDGVELSRADVSGAQ